MTISKGPLEVAQQIEMNIDYRVSPLLNEEITFMQLDGTDRGCSASISNNVDRKKQLLGTVTSISELREFSVTIQVYGIVSIIA
uniref:Uncharacterized protein n=1 Tax=Anopheles dirus TaxID=7168 RepID=A0A182NSK0_9DIPT